VTVRGPERSLWRVMFSPILPVHGQKLLLMAERVDSAFTATCRKEQPPPASRPAETSAGQRALLDELLPAGGGCLARPPLPSARHVVPELVLDWPPTSLAAPPPAPTGPRPSRRHLVTFARALLLVACSSPTPLVRHPPQHTLAQLSAHAPCVPRVDAPAPARPRATAPPVTSRVAHRTHAPPAHHIAALAPHRASLGHLTLTRLRTARRLPVRPPSPASPRGLRRH
jgi:hypothetical protein